MLDRGVEVFLDDLLEFVEDGKVVPIIGEELLRVGQNGDEIHSIGTSPINWQNV